MKKILIVDDDRVIGEMLKMLLGFSGFEVFFSERPDETEENIRKHEIDLVILDLLISGVNGTDVCVSLRNNETTAQTPILMMSAICDAGNICRDAGANDFIAKPFERNDLLIRVDKALNLN